MTSVRMQHTYFSFTLHLKARYQSNKKIINIDHQLSSINHLALKKRRKGRGKSKFEQVDVAVANVTDQMNKTNEATSKSHNSSPCHKTSDSDAGAEAIDSDTNKKGSSDLITNSKTLHNRLIILPVLKRSSQGQYGRTVVKINF